MLPRLRILPVVVFALVATACTSGPAEPAQNPINPPVPPTAPPVVGRLSLIVDTRESFVGLTLRIHVQAFDLRGNRIDSHQSTVTSSNFAVAVPDRSQPVHMQYPNAEPRMEALHFISMRSEGSAVIRVTQGNFTDSVTLTVRPLPQALNVLVVDSFTVVEYRPQCSWDCPYLLYAPLLKLREPTRTSWADVIAVEFSIPTQSTGLCTVEGVHFESGADAHVNFIDPYPWANDMIFVRLSGVPVPDGDARARVIVRDAAGNYGLIEATAPIQRLVANPVFPKRTFANVSWTCNN